MGRKLKYHEAKLLRKTDFLTWKQDNGHREHDVVRRYSIQKPEDYHRYNRLAGSIRQLAHRLSLMPPESAARRKHERLLLDKLYDMGLLSSTSKLSAVEHNVTVSAFARRRLPVVMTRLHMAETVTAAIKMIEQGQVRVGTEVVTDPAFFCTRSLEDFVTWSVGSKVKRNIMKYRDQLDDFELLQATDPAVEHWGFLADSRVKGEGVGKVHADASNFAADITKEEAYEQVLSQAGGLFDGQRNWVCNLANTSSLLWHAFKSLPAPSNQVNWAGFYTLDPLSPPGKPQLILGPFHGKVACEVIPFTRGVCGAAAATQRTQVVDDVDKFPGHIACDAESRSEIVVPIVAGVDGADGGGSSRVVAIIDVDCAVPDGFDDVDRKWLERLAELVGRSCDWP
ncbi:uncharacterized protein E0L32_006267 [Thyridium curvatum]|uniref:U3 small nucleolar ribonucleoprotein protein IMP3 n=1 Tax=Thyridium curvatum TaxID=1093900 RepID=A0A507B3I7_9PEZI|nr:uncharacterized protein E0L32_006267 [Thyridium curvatum]TPX13294.1 hypothetical protein E0L32_006267 [Thyridium curvatum]